MKFNFKKIASVLTSTVMLSSTIAFAAAANFPEPFVKDGVGSYAIVVGADGQDGNAATQLDSFLKGMITESDDSTAPITVEGESWMVADGDDKFNLGSDVSSVEDELDDDQLENLLSDLTYTNDDGDDFDYDQDITLSSALATGLQTDDDDNTYIGMDLADGDEILTYTLTFDDDAEGGTADGADEYPELSNTYLTMLGKEYYVSDVENVSGDTEITLLDSANKVTLNKGESQTITVGDQSYDVELTFVHSENGVKLTVDGIDTGLLDEGDTKKVSDGVYVSILENLAGEDADADSALISLGTGEIVLTNGAEVQINGDDISDIDAYNDATLESTIVATPTDLRSISFTWALGEDTEVKAGDELVLPGLETVKFILGDFVAKSEEVTKIKNSGDDQIVLETEVVDGEYSLPILFTGNDANFTGTGEDANTKLWTSDSASLSINQTGTLGDDYFVISQNSGDEGESYILAITDIDEDNDNQTTIENLVTGDEEVLDIGDDVRYGDITLTLAYSQGRNSTVTISSGGTEGFNYLVTKEGMRISLPNSTATNLSQGVDPVTLTVTEEDGDDNTIGAGASFTVSLTVGEDGTEVAGTNLTEVPETDGSDVSIAYVESELATKISLDENPDQSTLDITYHGEEAYVEAYVAAGDTVANGGGSSSGSMVVTDTSAEFDSVKASKNLIVLGGTCVNRVAAKVLSVDAQYPVCGSDWETLTTVGAGEFLIQTVTSPYSESKVAMLVAGYAQTDTANAVSTLKAKDDIEVANNVRYLNSGTTLTKG